MIRRGFIAMGIMNNGIWQPQGVPADLAKPQDSFRQWITADGASGFKAEPERYHLYISLACPWACRTLIFRQLKKLDKIISLSIVDPIMLENGWTFSDYKGCVPDTINHCQYLYEIYAKAKPDYSGRVTVPVLWDKKTQTIVNNESADIIRMFNSAFNAFTKADDFYPENLRQQIDAMNELVFSAINSGVYKCGFATNQADYDLAFDKLFSVLDELDKKLEKQRYLLDDQLTEADWRLFTTLIRFDPVYYVHFKCNYKLIKEYKNLYRYMQELYHYPGIAETVNFDHIKKHYYLSHKHLNPSGIVPRGPAG